MVKHTIFSQYVKIKYKNTYLSSAFTFSYSATVIGILLPIMVVMYSRGYILETSSFNEQPEVNFNYNYLLVAETNDPSRPVACGHVPGPALSEGVFDDTENCAEMEVQEYDDHSYDYIDMMVRLIVPPDSTISSILLILGLDFKLRTVCPFAMQSLAIITKEFSVPPSGFWYFGDIQFSQLRDLPCTWYNVDTRYNVSLFDGLQGGGINDSFVDSMLMKYFSRAVTTRIKPAFMRSQNGHTGSVNMRFILRIPPSKIAYMPSTLQKMMWPWIQFISLYVIAHFILYRIKKFFFNRGLIRTIKVLPWHKK